MAPLPSPACLERVRPSTQKGGTLIAEDVLELEAHEARRSDPDGYRPARCATCQHDTLHVHDYRERSRRGEAGPPVVVVRYRCAAADCGARWQVLPALLARHLWRGWTYVEDQVHDAPPKRRSRGPAPARTRRRWRARLRSAARFLVQVLAASGTSKWSAVAGELTLWSTRWQVVEVLAEPFARVAALLHRLVPGARLM